MCLTLRTTAKEEVKYIKSLKGPFIAYKLLGLSSDGKIHSPLYGSCITKWEKGKITVSNRESKNLTDYEADSCSVYYGLHLYRTREGARKGRKKMFYDAQIWKVEIQPQDVVAVGFTYVGDGFQKIQSCVVHKAKLLERVG